MQADGYTYLPGYEAQGSRVGEQTFNKKIASLGVRGSYLFVAFETESGSQLVKYNDANAGTGASFLYMQADGYTYIPGYETRGSRVGEQTFNKKIASLSVRDSYLFVAFETESGSQLIKYNDANAGTGAYFLLMQLDGYTYLPGYESYGTRLGEQSFAKQMAHWWTGLVYYFYDEAGHGANTGRRTSMYDATGSTSWTYDVQGRVTQETKVINGAGAFTTSYAYDAMDRVVTTTYPSGEVVTQTYNDAAQLAQVRSASYGLNYANNMAYNALGQLTALTTNNGNLTTNTTYDSLNFRLKRSQTGSLLDLSYGYDAVGNVKAITDTTLSQVQTFTYDALDRLTSVRGAYSEDYAYNAIGNLVSKTGVGSYTYGAQSGSCPDGALSKPHAVITAGSNTYCYDRNGNMVRRNIGSTYNLTYDVENRLTGVSGGTTATFAYDGDGTRVKATVNGVTTAYVGNHYEVNLTTGVTTSYYYAGNQRVAMRQAGVVSYLHGDHLNSASLATNASGGLVSNSTTRYYPYGSTRVAGSGLPTEYRFTGQRREAGLGGPDGLYFYNARWYDPSLGRFLSADTIVPNPGNPQSLNRYSYVLNNALKFTDPTGHYAFEENPDDPVSFGTNVRSQHDYTHPNYRAGNQSDAQFLAGATAPIWVPAVAVGGEVAAEGIAIAGTAGWEALRQTATLLSAKCLLNPLCAAIIYQAVPKPTVRFQALLQNPGDKAVVPRGQISTHIMAELQMAEDAEFALIRSKDGLRYLVRGYSSGAALPPDTARLIAHTHSGATIADTRASGLDQLVLQALNQSWSLIVNGAGDVARFFKP
jgi:RHS repeat-associated protein